MIVFILKILVLSAILALGVVCVWFSTPWGYKKPLYMRVVQPFRQGDVS